MRSALISAATADPRIATAALLGSSATGLEDAWSDIDLALGLTPDADPDTTIAEWTERMYADHGAVDHVDVHASGALYRVFLLTSTLQVDLSFWPSGALRARGERFRLLFGAAAEAQLAAPPTVEHLAGMAWLYLLHVRSSIARRRELQAAFFLDGARDQIVALACAHHGLPTAEARGADDLPEHVKREVMSLPPRQSGSHGAEDGLRALIAMLRARLDEADATQAERLARVLDSL